VFLLVIGVLRLLAALVAQDDSLGNRRSFGFAQDDNFRGVTEGIPVVIGVLRLLAALVAQDDSLGNRRSFGFARDDNSRV
jgi:hypothetical protein